MTKRTLRISDRDLIAIEALLTRLDAEFSELNRHEDPGTDDRTGAVLSRISDLEERALGRIPASMLGLAVQARVVARYVSCDSMVEKLIRNIETMAAAPLLEPGLRIQAGKRYRNGAGRVTTPLYRVDSRGLLFADDRSGDMYEVDGRRIGGHRGCAEDLVEEVAPQPRVVKRQPVYAEASQLDAAE
ncbi:hypothetical protein BA190_09975 [Labrys sp. WJW]|uniref:hypothetical protein n=1 Tax=Labrys sp. WJW TaxID=1737983 RepID=UPI000835605F|nr:hypothetical protein [Labrys sp. WJW]OCC05221.1 hypothetical protein BA190_09975 [Labrys sp. WJW]